jgi:uncharacterized protein (DUF111 family)
MATAALLSLTGAEKELRKALKKLPLSGYRLVVERGRSCGIAGTRVHVNVFRRVEARPPPSRHRRPAFVLVAAAGDARPGDPLPSSSWGGRGEGPGTTVDKVHFHEVGAVDAVVDVVSGCFLFELAGAKEAHCSPLPGGGGEAWSEHGKIPVPEPATLELLKGASWRFGEGEGELVTPTGAALLRAFDASFGRPPEMTARGVGIGLGHRELPGRPNMLRVVAGEPAGAAPGRDRVLEIEANIDDMTPSGSSF